MLGTHGRQGFTLAEIMVSTAIMLIVAGAVYQSLFLTGRLSRAQVQQVDVQSSVRSAALILGHEFRSLGAGVGSSGSESDLLSLGPSALVYRAERGFGLLCLPAGAGRITLGRASFAGHRDPQPGRDSVSLFVEGDPASANDDNWLALGISGVGARSCANGESPGIDLSVGPSPVLEGLPPGTPARIHETVELRLYRSENRSWLGMRSVSAQENIQPLAGPLRDADGLRLEYLSGAGLPTGIAAEVRSIRLSLQGQSDRAVQVGARAGEPAADSLSALITLRNAKR
ncbi:MAG TPA: prepilin-type N-terminal cleavage/methylation domain-containing protein [Gemmatimonadales bacterium]|nr:prepilin-type N-terminal cleavage/methylation domain-containing protein [Gemmatimonadales bacterium]